MSANSQTKYLSIYDGADCPLIEVDGFPVRFHPFHDELEIDWNDAKLTIKGLSKIPGKLK